MNDNTIIKLIENATGFTLEQMRNSSGGEALKARYVMVGIVVDHLGYSQTDAGRMLDIPRATILTNRNALHVKLDTDRVVKQLYRACTAALAQHEMESEGAI